MSGHIFPYPNKFISVRLILAIYSKINDEIESLEEVEDFEKLHQNLDEEIKAKKQAIDNGYDPLHPDDKNDNPESPHNNMMDDGNEGDDIELE